MKKSPKKFKLQGTTTSEEEQLIGNKTLSHWTDKQTSKSLDDEYSLFRLDTEKTRSIP